MKVGISERMSPCEQLWAESEEDRRTFAYIAGDEGAQDDSTYKNATHAQEAEDEDFVAPKPKGRRKVRRLTQAAMRRETLEF